MGSEWQEGEEYGCEAEFDHDPELETHILRPLTSAACSEQSNDASEASKGDADFRDAETEYIRATDLLARRLEERRAELEPDVLAVLDRTLAQIDAAIAAVRLVLDPDSGL